MRGERGNPFPYRDHRADFGECPLLGDKLPFLPGTNSPLETLSSLFHIYFSDRLPRATSRNCGELVTPYGSIKAKRG